MFVDEVHIYIGTALYIAAFACFLASSFTDPGTLTKENLDKSIKMYKYDNALFTKKDCETCKIQKPARSKHCSVCNSCVIRADHHCI